MCANRIGWWAALASAVWLWNIPALAQTDGYDDEFADGFDDYEVPPESGEEIVSPPEPPLGEDERARAFRSHNSWRGPTGGIHLVDGGSGLPGSFRLQLGIEGFSSSDFMDVDDDNAYMGGSLSFSWTIINHLEVFAHIANRANSNTLAEPELIQVIGDTTLGAKGYYPVLPWLIAGGDFRLVFLNPVGDIGLVGSGTSFGFSANGTADLRKLPSQIPLLVRLNLSYYFDNSSNLIEDVENEEFERLEDAGPRATEVRNLISRQQRFGLGISRYDSFFAGLGLEAPLQVEEQFFVHPILEWSFAFPVNRQGYICVIESTDASPGQPDGCFELQGWAAVPSNLTLGARVFPPLEGLGVMLAFDIGLTGTSTFVRELPGNRPYNVMFALSYAYDTTPPPVTEAVEVVKEVEVVKAPPPRTRISGLVTERGLGDPVSGAIVRYLDMDLTAQATDRGGRFISYGMDPGDVQVEVSHPDYESRVCVVAIPEVAPAPAPVPLAPAPVPAAQAPAPQDGGGPALAPVDASGRSLGAQPEGSVSADATIDADAVGGIGQATVGTAPTPSAAGAAGAAASTPAVSAEEPPAVVPMVELRCELTAKPRFGGVVGTVTGPDGSPVVGASVSLSGPSPATLTTDQQGSFRASELAAGSYSVQVDAEGYLLKTGSFEVAAAQQASTSLQLVKKPKRAQVEMSAREVKIRRKIMFMSGSAEISEKSHDLLSEIADVLLRNPQVELVEIQGHTDNRGNSEANKQLSQERAESVRAWLIGAGVAADRLEAKGYGDLRPLFPNITPGNRARNRRVQFIIRK